MKDIADEVDMKWKKTSLIDPAIPFHVDINLRIFADRRFLKSKP